MRKILKCLFMFVLLMPLMVFAEEECKESIIAESIKLIKTEGAARENEEATLDNNKINIDVSLAGDGDYLEYEIVLRNTSDLDNYIDENLLKIDSEYAEYEFIYDDAKLKGNETKTIYLRIKAKGEVPNELLDNGIYTQKDKINLVLTNEDNNNPDTGIGSIITVIVVLSLLLLISIIGFKKVKSLRYMYLFILLSLPLGVKALCKNNIELNINVTYNKLEAMFLPGTSANKKIKILAAKANNKPTDEVSFKTEDKTIRTIKRSNALKDGVTDDNIISTDESTTPIYAWVDGDILYYYTKALSPYFNQDSHAMFSYFLALEDIDGLKEADSSLLNNITYLFTYDEKLNNIDLLADWDISKITDLSFVFSGCQSLEDISPIANWNISNVTSIRAIFNDNRMLKDISPLQNWNTSKVTNMQSAFWDTNSLVDFSAIKDWDVSKVKNIISMFGIRDNGAKYDDAQIDLSFLANWKIDGLEEMAALFQNTNLISLEPLANWDVSRVTDFSNVFNSTDKSTLKSLKGLENWDVSNATNMSTMFQELVSLEDVSAIVDWDITKVTNFEKMFIGTTLRPTFRKRPGTWTDDGKYIPNN